MRDVTERNVNPRDKRKGISLYRLFNPLALHLARAIYEFENGKCDRLNYSGLVANERAMLLQIVGENCIHFWIGNRATQHNWARPNFGEESRIGPTQGLTIG